MRLALILFFLFSFFHLIISFIQPLKVPQSSFPFDGLLFDDFPYPPFNMFANFDGVHYILIAENGYGNLQQSFFPLYPMLMNIVSYLTGGDVLLAGILISSVCFFAGIVLFYKLAGLISKNNAGWAVIFLLSFPTAFYYQMVYPESLFLSAAAGALYFLLSKKYIPASILAILASMTKVQGVLLLIPFFLILYGVPFYKTSVKEYLRKIFVKKRNLLIAGFSPILGFLFYAGYLLYKHGDPLYFYHLQPVFGANRSSDSIILLPQVAYRYIKIFLTADRSFQYWVAVLEFTVFLMIFCVLVYQLIEIIRKWSKYADISLLAINLFSFAVVIMPTLTGTLTSFPRYALLAFGFYLALAQLNSKFIKLTILTIFITAQVVLMNLYLKGYFIS